MEISGQQRRRHGSLRSPAGVKTADIEDFIADLRKPRAVGKRAEERCLTPASISRTIELLRHLLNWAVGREYLDVTNSLT